VDRLYQELFAELIKAMIRGDLPIEQGTFLLWSGHSFERLADRVTNICERIVYSGTGDTDHLNPKPGDDIALLREH
jgi:phosphate transport system protein